MKVTILGGGNGAFAFAFHVTQMGHEVLMYVPEMFSKCLSSVKESGKIIAVADIAGDRSEIKGEVNITRTTTCVREASAFSKYLVLICPAFGQGPTFDLFLPHLTKHHVFISMPGNFAFFEYINIIRKYHNIDSDDSTTEIPFPCVLVESSTIPYACRKISDNEVFISGVKKVIQLGVFPSTMSDEIIEELRPLYQAKIIKVTNIIEAGLLNMNLVGHPPGVLFNAGWIEHSKGGFLFYNEGFTPSVYNVIKALDIERLKIGKFFGFQLDDHFTNWKKWYGAKEDIKPLDFFREASFYKLVYAPSDLKSRYITEDFSYCLIPLIKYICKPNNIETPISDCIITAARCLTDSPLKCERHFDNIALEYILKY